MREFTIPRAAEAEFIAAELKRLESIAKSAHLSELAHFIGVAEELAKLIISRAEPRPAGATTH